MQENISKIEKQKKFIIQFLYWSIIIGIIFFLGKYILPVLIPFIIAFIVAGILNKPINYISQKVKVKRKIIAVISLLLFLFCSSILISFLCSFVFSLIKSIFLFLPYLFDNFIIPLIEQAFEKLDTLFYNVDLSLLEILQTNTSAVLESINQAVSHISNGILSSLANVISIIPTLFMQTIITIIAMFFITLDFNKIVRFCKKQIPETKKEIFLEAKSYFINTLPKFVLSYVAILCLTFIELYIGFVLLRIPYAGLLALVIAILDIFPILGTGTFLIPWASINVITGDYTLAFGILILYITITIIRNIVEPKLIGNQMGLHPILTLASMLVGLKILGIWGLFGFPIAISLFKKLNDNGTIHFLIKGE